MLYLAGPNTNYLLPYPTFKKINGRHSGCIAEILHDIIPAMQEQTTSETNSSELSPPAPESAIQKLLSSRLYTAFIPLAFAIGIGIGYLIWGHTASTEQATLPSGMFPEGAHAAPQRYDVGFGSNPALGPADAPIVIIEFGDYHCGYCKKWHFETLQPLLAAFPDKILFLYRDCTSSNESIIAAQAAKCAGEQDRYWAFHNAIFTGKYGLGSEAYSKYASELGMDVQALNDCIQSERYADEVRTDTVFAANIGIRGTPVFFLNGIPIIGAGPTDAFIDLIKSELGE